MFKVEYPSKVLYLAAPLHYIGDSQAGYSRPGVMGAAGDVTDAVARQQNEGPCFACYVGKAIPGRGLRKNRSEYSRGALLIS